MPSVLVLIILAPASTNASANIRIINWPLILNVRTDSGEYTQEYGD